MCFTDVPRCDSAHKVILALQGPLEDGPSMLCGEVALFMAAMSLRMFLQLDTTACEMNSAVPMAIPASIRPEGARVAPVEIATTLAAASGSQP